MQSSTKVALHFCLYKYKNMCKDPSKLRNMLRQENCIVFALFATCFKNDFVNTLLYSKHMSATIVEPFKHVVFQVAS